MEEIVLSNLIKMAVVATITYWYFDIKSLQLLKVNQSNSKFGQMCNQITFCNSTAVPNHRINLKRRNFSNRTQ